MNWQDIGSRLQYAYETRDPYLSLTDLCRQAQITLTQWEMVCDGSAAECTFATMARLADTLRITLDWVMRGHDLLFPTHRAVAQERWEGDMEEALLRVRQQLGSQVLLGLSPEAIYLIQYREYIPDTDNLGKGEVVGKLHLRLAGPENKHG
jgi:hypothetical protein